MSARPGGGGGGNTAEERRLRLRDQMKAFYGDPDASTKRAASQSAGQGSPNVPPELDLDSEYFNVNRYTTDLLKRESLKGLVETDTDLLRRVRRLDGELQELVYRNYARFISATDTIREMKDSVVEMDAKLQTLSQNVNTIDGISTQISKQLQVHRSHIEDTITANRMLKKVQFLTSLPVTMRRLLDKEEYSACAKYWVAGDGFLSKYKSIASITQIQKQCRTLALELYSAIEHRMCAYPLDDPDAMDCIRSYVEDLRLLRATSLSESEIITGQAPFEEAVLQTLMKSVTTSFQTNAVTTQRSLKAALAIPDNLHDMDVAKREASLAQVNLREPLVLLKNACAMLAVNSERVNALLGVEESSSKPSASLVAKAVEPVLLEVLQPVSQSLADCAMAHLSAIAMDGGSALRNPDASAAALQSAATHLAKLLKQFDAAMTTLGTIHLVTTTATSPSGAVGSPTTNAVHQYTRRVHEVVCNVVRQCCDRMQDEVWRGPDRSTLQAYVPLPISNSSMLNAVPSVVEAHTQQLAFVLSRFLFAALAQCTATSLRTTLIGEDAVPLELLGPLADELEKEAQLLQHRAVVLLGQWEVSSVYEKAFRGGGGEAHSDGSVAAAAGVPAVPEVLLQLLPEWSAMYEAVKALPPVTAVSAPTATTATAGFRANSGARVPVGRRRDNSSPASGGGAYRVGGGGSSTGERSDQRVGETTLQGGVGSIASLSRGGGSGGGLAVAHTRQVMSALQMSVKHIFANTETALRTQPVAGPPSLLMACMIRYLLQGILDRVRDEVTYTEAQFYQVQVSCTFLLYALASPAKGTAPRQWRKEWGEAEMNDIQRLLDEICASAYDKYEAKVPLSTAVLDRAVEAVVHGGRAAVAAATAGSPVMATATTALSFPSASTAIASTQPQNHNASTSSEAAAPPPPAASLSPPISAAAPSAPSATPSLAFVAPQPPPTAVSSTAALPPSEGVHARASAVTATSSSSSPLARSHNRKPAEEPLRRTTHADEDEELTF